MHFNKPFPPGQIVNLQNPPYAMVYFLSNPCASPAHNRSRDTRNRIVPTLDTSPLFLFLPPLHVSQSNFVRSRSGSGDFERRKSRLWIFTSALTVLNVIQRQYEPPRSHPWMSTTNSAGPTPTTPPARIGSYNRRRCGKEQQIRRWR